MKILNFDDLRQKVSEKVKSGKFSAEEESALLLRIERAQKLEQELSHTFQGLLTIIYETEEELMKAIGSPAYGVSQESEFEPHKTIILNS